MAAKSPRIEKSGKDKSTKKKRAEGDEVAVPDIGSKELKINDKIGEGCFGVVYRGVCRGKIVAIKKLNQHDLEEKTMQEFKKEVAILTHLRHPNILLFMGACTEAGQLAIVTEFMNNSDMHKLLRNPSVKLTPLKLLEMARQVAQAMTWLHCSHPPIIHRDLKPSNILVDENFNVKICDFGLSAFQKTKTLKDKGGVAPGTPLWMSPEVLQGKVLTEKVDVYSFAMVLWEMFTGKEPFEEFEDYDTFVNAVCCDDKRPDFPEGMHPSLRNLISSCWSTDVKKRPSFEEIVVLLNVVMVDSTIVNDPEAASMWKLNWNGEVSVSWTKFVTIYYSHFNFAMSRDPEKDDKYKCLKFFLVVDSQEPVVTLERFGDFLKWFGPSKIHGNDILTRLENLLQCPWFHGDLSREKAEAQLNSAGKGTFLVRLSTTEPERSPFTISKVSKTGDINHQRIYAKSGDELGYFTHVKVKNNTKKVEADGGLENLIEKVKKSLRLKKPCPGHPYSALFSSFTTSYQVDPEVAENDSDSG